MPRAQKPRRRKKVSDVKRIALRLTRRFFRIGDKIADKEGWVFTPHVESDWSGAIKRCFDKQNEWDAVHDLAYLMAWARERRVLGKGSMALSNEELQSIGDADYLDQMRAFYRRNIRSIAQLYLELSAA